MRRQYLFLFSLIIFMPMIFLGCAQKQRADLGEKVELSSESIRQPAVAGQFYPGDKEELIEMISQFLEKAALSEKGESDSQIRALIVPHAGYVYSGQVAAYGFKAIQGRAHQNSALQNLSGRGIKTVILIGSSHHQYFSGAVIDGHDAWQTALGKVEIDAQLRDILVKENSAIKIDSAPHQLEHSLEVELPFLQRVLQDFKIVPILMGGHSQEDIEILSQALAKNIDEQTLLIASSDMSHYPPYEQANYADKKVIEAILTGQIEKLRATIADLEKENIPNLATCLCGQVAVEVVMKVAQEIGAQEIKLLKYANSGDVAIGDKSQVVGYSAISFSGNVTLSPSLRSRVNSAKNPEQAERDPEPVLSDSEGASPQDDLLNSDQQKTLLQIAKTSVENYILRDQIPQFKIDDPLLNQPMGAFVTLKKQGALRGCIGRFSDENLDLPLYQVVSQMAIAAATQDSRFYPVQLEELDELEYEVSVLSPLRKIDDWREIEIGQHGVQVRQGFHSGVFLPQVATENNWDLDRFMGELCSQKAGLSWDCWKNGDVDLYIFTAEVFHE